MRRSAVRLAALVAAVAAVHLLLADAALDHMRGLESKQREPERLTAQYVAEVRLGKPRAAPQPPPPPPPPQHHTRKAAPAQPPASEPEPAASAPEPQPPASAVGQADVASDAASDAVAAQAASDATSAAPQALAAASEPVPPPPAASPPASTPPVVAAASAASAAVAADDADRPFGFDWPQSTRIRYKLKGNYRGEVHGKAEVEWLRQGLHYQVHVDMEVALLFSRRVSSDGQITASGLAPRHFVQEVKVSMFGLSKQRIEFGDEEVTLANGNRVPTLPGLQDEASQFVQLTYEFTRNPERLQAGRTVTLQMVRARAKRLEPFVYDVMPPEPVQTPMGTVQAFRLVPRPDPSRARSDFILELWFSPELEYLPVRLRMTDADPTKNTYADLVIDRLPERARAAAGANAQAAPPAR